MDPYCPKGLSYQIYYVEGNWVAAKETLPPAALQKQQQGGLLMVSGGCSPLPGLQTGAGACLQLQTDFIPKLLFLSCHGEATLTLISTGLQLTEADSRFFSVYVVTVELVQ